MIKTIQTAKLAGLKAIPVTLEASIKDGIGIHLVGLADVSVKEALLRTVTAIQALGYHIPGKKIILNLAPADLVKESEGYDLPIALGLIAVSETEPLTGLDDYLFAGEVGLDGSLRGIPGWFQYAELASELGKACILPKRSALLAAEVLGEKTRIYGVNHLREVIDILNNGAPEKTAYDEFLNAPDINAEYKPHFWDALAGETGIRRALEIAAAGGHHLFLMGAPGSGKGVIARALREILPPMTKEENLEVQRVYSATHRELTPGVRPFRAPHASAYISALLGGGSGDMIRPGEVSLAHNGVLFLDEYAEIPKASKEALRAPEEDRKVVISRLRSKVEFPARHQLVLASNPCPCGYYGEGDRCTCTSGQRQAYLSHLSGPVFDSVDIQLWVHPPKVNQCETAADESLSDVAERVEKARFLQKARQGKLNAELNADEACKLTVGCTEKEVLDILETIITRLGLSAKSYTRILRIARTIADIENEFEILPRHIAEAASYRFLDRKTL